MLVSTTTDYLVSIAIDKSSDNKKRRVLLMVSLIINLGLLFIFKYLQFTLDNVWVCLQWFGLDRPVPVLDIILPLGISFYTFQTISYTVDVYRRIIKPERDYLLFSVYVMYFPQLVAGPILRACEVLPQLSVRPRFDWNDILTGARRILFGLFLKVVVADNIAPLVDDGFDLPSQSLSALDVWTLAFLFGFQIYFDFSAYSHIAIGSARMMGIQFPENFNFPYSASSPRDFWKRWHISLSSWIRDYLYLPLAGAKVHDRSTGGLATAMGEAEPSPRWTKALFLTWAIMGLWHGAAWRFLLWGLWHAVLVMAYRKSDRLRQPLPMPVRYWGGRVLTLGFVMLSWIPFRAPDLATTASMLSIVCRPESYLSLGMRENTYLVAACLALGTAMAHKLYQSALPVRNRHPAMFAIPEVTVYFASITLVFIFLRPIEQFIYFQF